MESGLNDVNKETGVSVKRENPSDPLARLEEVGAKFLQDVGARKAVLQPELDEALAIIRDNGREHYGEFVSEAYSDFATAFMGRVMPVYGRDYIEFWPTVDRWLFENVYSKGAEMEMLALFQSRGASVVLGILKDLTPQDAPSP